MYTLGGVGGRDLYMLIFGGIGMGSPSKNSRLFFNAADLLSKQFIIIRKEFEMQITKILKDSYCLNNYLNLDLNFFTFKTNFER